ncbi:MAG TPA: excinuclease ABC subunit UvrC [Candidatus Cloacimonadota bacterium]|nr:excinuclease ABC subunit UvrC [Candidatus Cloacimonadota bacterium]HPT71444.1 excinuclease ABC subunit UvrC [Candidatus Cloacimonadota bacterium]
MAEISQALKEKLLLLPDKPGVYQWLDEKKKVIYVGKALNLKNRVKSYVTGVPVDRKTRRLVEHIADLDYIITNTESEAFALEANLIKKYRPKYNILLKDDKRYPFIKITLNEPFPRIIITRDLMRDGSKYFGPYTDVKYLRRTLRSMEWMFPVRNCKRIINDGPPQYERACINYQLGLCTAPCVGKISRKDYRKIINQIMNFLSGKHSIIIEEMKEEMQRLSSEMNFEEAAKFRDRIKEVEKIQNSQTMYFTDEKNRDIIGIYQEENLGAMVVLKMRAGKLINKELYPLTQLEDSTPGELMSSFLGQYYSNVDDLPHDILLQVEPDDFEVMNEWLHKRILLPQRGEKNQLITMARQNAFNYVEEQKLSHLRKTHRTVFPVQELKDRLNLPKLPRKIVCFDISTIQGTDTVASGVFFENGKPLKKQYRHFIIKTVSGQDDFASMAETLDRYLKNVQEQENEKPDLIIIDGGKGQLSSANAILKRFDFPDILIMSLAKRIEEIFIPDHSHSIILPRSSSALRLITNIRDEAHRFAITFHRQRRSSRTLVSDLDQIKGVGEKTKFLLLKEFGSVAEIMKAKPEDLAKVKGIGLKLARAIIQQLQEIRTSSTP